MITNALIQFFYGIFAVIVAGISQLSDVAPNSDIVAGITTARGYLGVVPFPFFLVSLLGSLAFFVVFETFYFGYKIVRWLYSKIPGVT